MIRSISVVAIFCIALLVISWLQVMGQDTPHLANQVQTHDKRGRLVRLDDYDSAGRLIHYQIYDYSRAGGALEMIDYSANGTVSYRLRHQGGPTRLPWREYFYYGLSDLYMISEYKPVRNRRQHIIGWNRWIIYESEVGGWLKK